MKLYRLEQYQECYTLYKDLLKNTQVKIQKEEKSILLLDLKISKKHLSLSKFNLCYRVGFWQWNIFSVCLWIYSEVHSISWQVFQSFRFIKSIEEEMHLKCKVTHYYYSCSTLFNLYLMLGTWVIVLHFERFFCNNKKKQFHEYYFFIAGWIWCWAPDQHGSRGGCIANVGCAECGK